MSWKVFDVCLPCSIFGLCRLYKEEQGELCMKCTGLLSVSCVLCLFRFVSSTDSDQLGSLTSRADKARCLCRSFADLPSVKCGVSGECAPSGKSPRNGRGGFRAVGRSASLELGGASDVTGQASWRVPRPHRETPSEAEKVPSEGDKVPSEAEVQDLAEFQDPAEAQDSAPSQDHKVARQGADGTARSSKASVASPGDEGIQVGEGFQVNEGTQVGEGRGLATTQTEETEELSLWSVRPATEVRSQCELVELIRMIGGVSDTFDSGPAIYAMRFVLEARCKSRAERLAMFEKWLRVISVGSHARKIEEIAYEGDSALSAFEKWVTFFDDDKNFPLFVKKFYPNEREILLKFYHSAAKLMAPVKVSYQNWG